jgi:hypothetical protein
MTKYKSEYKSEYVNTEPYTFDDYENVMIEHRGIPNVNKSDVFWIRNLTPSSSDLPSDSPSDCDFLYIKSPEHDEEYFYFTDNKEIIEPLYAKEKNDGVLYVYGIDFSDRKFCIELKMNMYKEFYINYITTLPEGCSNKMCQRLDGLFSILYCFLKSINYKGRIALKDDAMKNSESLLYTRLKEGKGSIYEKYGFEIDPIFKREINEALKNSEYDKLRKLTRNVPMIAQGYSMFNKC